MQPASSLLPIHPLRSVTAAERRAFEEDGVALLKGIYPEAWVNRLRDCLEDIFAMEDTRADLPDSLIGGRSKLGARADMLGIARFTASSQGATIALDGGTLSDVRGRSIVETDAAQWHEAIRDHHLYSPLPEILHQLTGSQTINFYCDQLFLKEPGSLLRTPFHQDKPYFLVDGGDVAVAWIPVDRVDRQNGAMGYVRGSHRSGKTWIPSDFVTDNGTFPEVNGISFAGLDRLPEVDPDSPEVSYFDASPGDVIVHHWGTLHGSSGNQSALRIRRAASIRYALDGCRFFNRPSSPEPFRNTVGLEDGARLESSPRFPVVWPRQTGT